jgi:hypothetical protein
MTEEEMIQSFLDFLKKEDPTQEYYAISKETKQILKGEEKK